MFPTPIEKRPLPARVAYQTLLPVALVLWLLPLILPLALPLVLVGRRQDQRLCIRPGWGLGRVGHWCRSSSSHCSDAKNDSATALSRASPTVPIEPSRPARRSRSASCSPRAAIRGTTPRRNRPSGRQAVRGLPVGSEAHAHPQETGQGSAPPQPGGGSPVGARRGRRHLSS